MKTYKLMVWSVTLMSMLSCSRRDIIAETRLQSRIDSMERVIINLQNDTLNLSAKASIAENKLAEAYRNMPSLKDMVKGAITSYAYVLIKYDEESYSTGGEFIRSKPMLYVSGIQEVMLWDEDVKYRLLDEQEIALKNSSYGKHIKVKSREAYNFHTYAEASKSHEQY